MKRNIDIEQLIGMPVKEIKKLYMMFEMQDNLPNNGNLIDWEYYINNREHNPFKGFWTRFIYVLDIPTLQDIITRHYSLTINIDTHESITSVYLYTESDEYLETRCPEQIDALFAAVKFVLEMNHPDNVDNAITIIV